MNNQHSPFNVFGHTYQHQPNNQSSNYSSQNLNQYNHPPNYPPQSMSYPNPANNSYGGFSTTTHNSFTHHPSTTPKQESPQNKNPQLDNYDTSISIEKLTPKQLLCECIDLATSMLKQVVDAYTTNNEIRSPYEGKVNFDLKKESNRLFAACQLHSRPKSSGDDSNTYICHNKEFLAQDDQSVKALVKSWIFQLKYIRNLWAHSEKVNYRLAFRQVQRYQRGYDTLGLLFDSFGGDQNSDLYRKIETYRKALLIAQVKSGIF